MPYHTQDWFIQTPIQDGEIFSSWLIRSALDMGCSPLTLTDALWGKWRAFTIDLDRGVKADRLELLLSHSFEDKQKILQSMLSNAAPYLNKNINNSWVLSLGQRNRLNFSGRQICPSCLKDDGMSPYLRLMWRMGWHCCCIKHQINLIDHCPECGVVIQPFKIDIEHGSLAICSSCSNNLSNYQSQTTNKEILDFQTKADKVFKTGSGMYNNQNISSVEWFEIARAWISEIRLLVGTNNIQLIEMFKSFDMDIDIPFPLTPIAFEYLNIHERIILLFLLSKVMKIPCDLIVKRSYQYGISNASFWDKRRRLPMPLQQMKIAMMNPTRIYALQRVKPLINQPKSKKTVQRKWLNLLRKLKKETGGYLD